MIEMKQLKFFYTCVETGNFSKAAELLYTTQPNVSKTIKALETQLGTALFERTARGIRPTPDGERVYQYARSILRNEEYLQMMSRGHKAEQLYITSMPSRMVASLFADYYNSLADHSIQCKFEEGSADEVIAKVESHRSDIGFLYIGSGQMPSFSYMLERRRLRYHELEQGELVIYLGPKNPYYHEPVITKDMLSAMHFLKNDDTAYSFESIIEHGSTSKQLQANLKNALVTNSDHVSMELLGKTSLAIISASLPSWREKELHGDKLRNKELRSVSIEGVDAITFGYVCRDDDKLNATAHRFLSQIRGIFRKAAQSGQPIT